MITGVHAIIFTTDAEGDRAFFQDVLEFPSVDAGGGWLIFALPPAGLAAHPAEEAASTSSTSCVMTSTPPRMVERNRLGPAALGNSTGGTS